jgi:vacuolar-type H+-ATPase subunit B/Vma2
VIAEEVTVRDPPVAVMVLEPAVLSVMLKVPTPEVRLAAAGRVAAESEEVMVTVLAKEVAVLP